MAKSRRSWGLVIESLRIGIWKLEMNLDNKLSDDEGNDHVAEKTNDQKKTGTFDFSMIREFSILLGQ